METVANCPVCASEKHQLAFKAKDQTVGNEQFSVQRCSECGFLFTSPRPDQSRIGAYYISDNYISHIENAQGFKDRIYHWVRKRAIQGKHKLIAKYQPTGKLLDVGCGTGDFLAYMAEQNYAAQGVEVSGDARKIATSKGLQLTAELGGIPAQAQFNAITLWHVLEHVPNPRATLNDLNARCASGGVLIIAVPDNESRDAQHYGPSWAAWDVPRHLSHFRRRDVENLLKQTGFQLLEIKPMWLDAPYVSMLSEQHTGAGNLLSMVKGWTIGVWSNAIAASSKRPTSSSLFVARKL